MFGSWVLVASIVIIAVSVVLGALVGGRDARTHTTTALVSGLRFGSLGLIIMGTQLDGNPDYRGPAITFALLDFVLPLILAVEVGRKVQPASKGGASAVRRGCAGVNPQRRGEIFHFAVAGRAPGCDLRK